MRRVPTVTLAVALLAAVVHWLPILAGALVYDRARVLDGDVWRVVTGSLVHVSRAHLLANLAAVLLLGAVVERRGRARAALLYAGAAAAVGVALLALAPTMARYAGLSGVVHALLAAAALDAARGRGARRLAGIGVLLLLVARIAVDVAHPRTMPTADGGAAEVAAVAHLAGVAAALLLAGARGVRWATVARAGPLVSRRARAYIPRAAPRPRGPSTARTRPP